MEAWPGPAWPGSPLCPPGVDVCMSELINAGPWFHPRECRLAHSSALQSELSLDQAIFSPPRSTTEELCT